MIYLFVSHKPNPMCPIKDKKSNLQKLIYGVPQGSITEPTVFSSSLNNLFFFVSSASMYKFVDDSSLSAIAKTVTELKITLQFFFSIWVFFHEHSQFTGQQGKGEAISLTPLYHFHPLHRHLDISH